MTFSLNYPDPISGPWVLKMSDSISFGNHHPAVFIFSTHENFDIWPFSGTYSALPLPMTLRFHSIYFEYSEWARRSMSPQVRQDDFSLLLKKAYLESLKNHIKFVCKEARMAGLSASECLEIVRSL